MWHPLESVHAGTGSFGAQLKGTCLPCGPYEPARWTQRAPRSLACVDTPPVHTVVCGRTSACSVSWEAERWHQVGFFAIP
jgi:hypothetical protein